MRGCIEVSEGLAGWVRDFESIRSSLMYLGMKRVIHRAHVEKLQDRQIEDGTSIVHRWMQQNYAESMLIGLRRILDKRKGSFSLIKLLEKLDKNHALFTYERYLQLWSNGQPEVDDLWLGKLYAIFSRDGCTIDRKQIQTDINKVLKDYGSVQQYINTVVAHQSVSDSSATTVFPAITWEDLDNLFDEVTALFNKYYALVKPGVHVDFAPVLPAGFQRAFERMVASGDG